MGCDVFQTIAVRLTKRCDILVWIRERTSRFGRLLHDLDVQPCLIRYCDAALLLSWIYCFDS